MDGRLRYGFTVAGWVVLGVIFVCLSALYASSALTAIIFGLLYGLKLEGKMNWVSWLLVSPIVYIAWLHTFLIACAIDVQVWKLLFGYAKPRRALKSESFQFGQPFFLTIAVYIRQYVIYSLPCAQAYMMIPGLRNIVLLAFSTSTHLGRNSQICGTLYDPDITEIGAGAVLGGGSTISAHSFTTTPDGDYVLVTAPVKVGPRSVVGGQARLALGVQVGSDSVIEPCANVTAFTVIGDGEIWGGNPAKFLRKRFDHPDAVGSHERLQATFPPSLVMSESVASGDSDDLALRVVVAAALDIPLEEVCDDLDATTCAAWDSLGQLGIASGVHARFGIVLSAEDSFRLRSMQDLRRVLQRERTALGANPTTAIDERVAVTRAAIEIPGDPELLPLFDHEQITRALASQSPSATYVATSRAPIQIVVAATFTAEPLANSLKLWCRAFGIPVEIRFAGFNQVQQCLMSSDSEFHRNGTGLNIVLTRVEDLLSGNADPDSLFSAMEAFAKTAPGTLIVGTLPPVVSTFVSADRASVDGLRTSWRNRISSIDGVRLLEFSEIVERIGVDAAGQVDLEVVARSPYAPRVFQELGIALARFVRRQTVAPAKVVALDADGVLWGGVLDEDGISGIQLGADHPGRSFQLFQQQVLELKHRGCLLVLVSRNAPEDVWRVFDEHPEMRLRREDITAARINWQPKSQNLRELAAELNLGLDAFVFFDDDLVNRAEVAAHAPGVTVVPLPTQPALYCQTLSRLWRFDNPHVTNEDRARSEMMGAERQRQQVRKCTTNLEAYLHSLQLRVEMRLATEHDLPRISQLTQKTNQFNLSLKRRSIPEVKALGAAYKVYAIEAADRFGDYGMIGACILARDPAQPTIPLLDTFLLSCRVLGRGVEDAVLHGLCLEVAAMGGTSLRAPFVTGPRNQPCRDFCVRASFAERIPGEFEIEVVQGHPLPDHIEWFRPTLKVQNRVA